MTPRSLLLVVAVATSLPAAPCAAQLDRNAARSFEAPEAIGRMASADFDRDGRRDLAVHVRDVMGPAVYVFFDRDGSLLFPEIRRIGVATYGGDLYARDLDGDGNPDLVRHAGAVSGLFGLDAGRFSAETPFLSEILTRIAFLDADRDGRLDVAGLDAAAGTVRIALQIAGQPGRFQWFSSVMIAASSLAAADFDGDGRADLAVGGPRSAITLLRGDGAGRFAPGVPIDVDYPFADLIPAALGGGPNPDLVGFIPGGVFSGQAILGSAERGLTLGPKFGGFTSVPRAAAGDVDGDGLTELVVPADSGIRVYRSLDGGAFDAPRFWPLGCVAGEVLADDFTGDGLLDVAVVSVETPRQVHVLRGRHGSDFAAPTPIALRAPSFSIASADFDGDGNADFALGANASTHGFEIAYGDGRGGVRESSTAGPARSISFLAAGDVTGDGISDVVSSLYGVATVWVGDGAAFTAGGSFGSTTLPYDMGLELADTDGDGVLNVMVLGSRDLPIFTIDARGAMVSRSTVAFPSGSTFDVAAADVDGDGVTDLVIANPELLQLSFARGNGAGGFFPPVALPVFAGIPSTVDVADVNGDGALDMIASSGFPAALEVALAAPGGGFLAPQLLGLGGDPGFVQVAEVTGDGNPDVVALQSCGVSIVPGDGAGGWGPRYRFAAGGLRPAVTDFDGDGQMDFAAVGFGSRRLALIAARRSPAAEALRGTVGLASGRRADVLFVNESAGDAERTVAFSPTDALRVRLDAAPGAAASRFALYFWAARADAGPLTRLPFGLGTIVLGTPLGGGAISPRAIFNNAGHRVLLGAPTNPSSPAPSTVVSRPNGVGRPITFTVQGIIADPGALNGRASVTNGVMAVVR